MAWSFLMGDDRLGNLNFATFAQAAPKPGVPTSTRTTAFDRHNMRLGVNFVSAVKDERPGIQYGEDGEDWITVDLTYRFEFNETIWRSRRPWRTRLDRDPPPGAGRVRLRPVDGESARAARPRSASGCRSDGSNVAAMKRAGSVVCSLLHAAAHRHIRSTA